MVILGRFDDVFDDEFLNRLNIIAGYLEGMGYKYEESFKMAKDILNEAKKTNNMNKSVQEQINILIAESGTSDSEVLQARFDAEGNEYSVLKERLDEEETETKNKFQKNKKPLLQTDYVEMFSQLNNFQEIGINKINADDLEIFAQNSFEGVRYILKKDNNDDYRKLGTGSHYYLNPKVENTNIEVVGNGWVTTNLNHYTTNIGDSFKFDFTGESCELEFLTDNRGGLWDIWIDGKKETEISVWRETASTIKMSFEVENGSHEFVGVFKGQDPMHPTATPRGWVVVKEAVVKIFNGKYRYNIVDILHESSNKEFAFSFRYNGTADWFPEHNGRGTIFDHTFVINVDNVRLDFDAMQVGREYKGEKLSVMQSFNGYHSDGITQLARFRTVHHLDQSGFIKYFGKMTAINEFEILRAYPLMLPVVGTAHNIVITGYGNSKKNDGSSDNYYFTEELNECNSAMTSTDISGFGSYVSAATLLNTVESMRINEDDTPLENESIFYWQRPTTPKIYFQSMLDKKFVYGDEYSWGGKIGVSSVQSHANFKSF